MKKEKVLPAIVVGRNKKKETQGNEFCEVCTFSLGCSVPALWLGLELQFRDPEETEPTVYQSERVVSKD